MVAPIVAAGARAALGRGAKAGAMRAAAAIPGGGEEKQQRISKFTAVLMVSLAVIVDLLQFFLTLSGFLMLGSLYMTFLAACIFGIWFALHDISYFSGKKALPKMLAVMGGLVAELLVIINALPITTLSVLTVILLSWAEDRES